MRVKKNTADDLIDALKHLKITDRRSRLSFRARPATLWGSRCVKLAICPCLARSSTATEAIESHLDLCHACDYCVLNYQPNAGVVNEFGGSWQNTETPSSMSGYVSPLSSSNYNTIPHGSDYSPFTASTGVLYSTLPTNFEFPAADWIGENIRLHATQSHQLRRSCGAGLSCLTQESPVRPTSASRSSFTCSFNANVDGHRCCLHHSIPPVCWGTHLKVYRRLYSLIDHPCVSIYRTLNKSHSTDSHIVIPKFLRRTHSSKYRYPTAQHVCDFSSRREQVLNPFVAPKISLSDELNCTSFRNSIRPIPQQRYSVQLCTCSDDQSPKVPTTFAAEQQQLANNDVSCLQPYRRGRRNSDPQPWQQNRCDESSCSDEHIFVNSLSALVFRPSILTQRTPLKSSVVEAQLNTNHSLDESSDLQNPSHPSDLNYLASYENSSTVHPHIQENTTKKISADSDTSDQSRFRFQSQFTTSHPSPGRPSNLPRFTPSNRTLNQDDCTPSGDSTPQPLFDSKPTLSKPPTAGLLLHASGDGDGTVPQIMRSLEHELSLIEQTESNSGTTSLDANRPLVTDVSVNELASYMEHMVHIPGRMSEMAQRMYL